MPNIGLLLTAAFCFVIGFHSDVRKPTYKAVTIDGKGQLVIELALGGKVKPPKLPNQIAFEDPRISPDGETVGWLADYPFPGATNYVADPISGNLVLYRAGHIVQHFPTGQVFWSWKFADSYKVAYCTGPTHGGAGECDLRDIASGRILARWLPDGDNANTPAWAQGLSY
jgi:hypothetical protein